jgi:hypothetical protein
VQLQRWSWVRLLAFCVSNVVIAGLVLAALVATAALALGSAGEAPGLATVSQSFSGIVTDSYCGARHKDSTKTTEECARECLRKGAKYLLVNGDEQYVLVGNPNILRGLVGQRARISGIVEGGRLRVGSVSFTP